MATEVDLGEGLPRIKQMVRWLGAVTTETTRSAQDVDEEVSMWLASGYKLFATHFIGADTGVQAFGVLYVLIKE